MAGISHRICAKTFRNFSGYGIGRMIERELTYMDMNVPRTLTKFCACRLFTYVDIPSYFRTLAMPQHV